MKDAMNYFPEATCQIIRSVVSLSSILGKKVDNIGLTISRLEEEVTNINVALQEKLQRCKEDADKIELQKYQIVCSILQSKEQIKIIAKLTGKNEQEVPENLRNKHVLFFISDFDQISIDSINIVKRLDRDSRKYEIIWIPIVDRLTYEQTKFTELESKMTWTVVNPSQIEQAVIRYIKTEWHFIKYPMAVSLNGEGEVTCPNALHMLLTWGNSAFPFTKERENELWGNIDEQTGWKLDLLVTEQINSTILSWGQSTETFVCLFGGENPTWIQDFTAKVKEATTAACISLKMAYAGKNKGKGLERNKLGADIQVIESEYRHHFWSRLESIFYSKTQLEKNSITDRVMREVMKVLSYDGSGGDWAIFAMGSEVMVTTNAETARMIMSDYKYWKKEAAMSGFLQGLKNYMNKMPHAHGCIHVHLPVLGHIPGTVICPECSKEMEMYYAYRCCA